MNFTEMLNNLTMGRALIIGFAIAGIYYFIFFDSGASFQTNLENNRAEKIRIEGELATLERKIADGLEYQKTVSELGGTMQKLLALIPEKFSKEDLMKIVSNEAKIAGSNLIKVSSVETRSNDGSIATDFQKYQVDVELNGSFVQHMIFLSSLTKVNQLLTVHKMDLVSSKQTIPNEPVMIKMNASIVAYRYVPGKQMGEK